MSNDSDSFHYTVWVKGSGTDYLSIKKKGEALQFPISCYRCENCGLMEFYANRLPENWKAYTN